MLLDVHPQPKPSPIEVRTGSGTTELGQLEYSPDFIRTMSNADEALVTLDRDGTFSNEREVEFLLGHHFDSLGEWEDYMAREAEYYLPPGTAMIETIGQQLSTGGGKPVLMEWVQASRFGRVG